jgi:hypothetical protein
MAAMEISLVLLNIKASLAPRFLWHNICLIERYSYHVVGSAGKGIMSHRAAARSGACCHGERQPGSQQKT